MGEDIHICQAVLVLRLEGLELLERLSELCTDGMTQHVYCQLLTSYMNVLQHNSVADKHTSSMRHAKRAFEVVISKCQLS